jgi:hypothetical protein
VPGVIDAVGSTLNPAGLSTRIIADETLTNYIDTDMSYADDTAFQWRTALSSALGCDPATSSTCATSADTDSTAWNDGLLYYERPPTRTPRPPR